MFKVKKNVIGDVIYDVTNVTDVMNISQNFSPSLVHSPDIYLQNLWSDKAELSCAMYGSLTNRSTNSHLNSKSVLRF